MKEKTIVLVNLGTPDNPQPEAVGRYLKEFLMDPMVVDIPRWVRWILVNILIVPRRKHRSSHAYSKVWQPNGSPLMIHTSELASRLQNTRPNWKIYFAMRYGSPHLTKVLTQAIQETEGDIHVVPLYPQFAKSSAGTVWALADQIAKENKAQHRVQVLENFYEDPNFISAFAKQVTESIKDFKPDHILYSYHGLPEKHVKQTAASHCLKQTNCCEKITEVNKYCYRAQCFATTRALAAELKLDIPHSVAFQSRLGKQPWIKPYTDEVLEQLAESGTKKVLVVCPAFVADCLETLEEIRLEAKKEFQAFGGEDLRLVPSLNAEPHWVENFSKLVETTQLWQPAQAWEQLPLGPRLS